jgi:protein-S-isoprenylcysteine O-methyltransferase Ste14
MAETRQLVTSGPYRFVRHPLYLAEEIAIFGVFVQFASLWTAILFAAHIAVQLRRMHNEESVLTASFPEYAAYRRKTARQQAFIDLVNISFIGLKYRISVNYIKFVPAWTAVR